MTLDLDILIRTRQVAQRRVLEQKAKIAKPTLPKQAELAYQKSLVRVVEQAQAQIWKEIEPLTASFKSSREDALPPSFAQVLDRLKNFFTRLVTGSEIRDLVETPILQVDQHVKRRLLRLITVTPELTDIGMGALFDQFVRQNVDLIRDVLTSQVDDLAQVISQAHAEGLRQETLADLLQERFDFSRKRALFIARDQILTLNAQITEQRHRNLGIQEYIWDSSQDVRVRKDHKHLHGRRIRYSDPPIENRATGNRAHAGIPIACRCQQIPIVVI